LRNVEDAANQSPGLETIGDAAQCGRVVQVVLQLTDGVRSAIGEEREHMRLALRKTHVGQKFLESHSRRGNPLIYGPADSVARAHPAVR